MHGLLVAIVGAWAAWAWLVFVAERRARLTRNLAVPPSGARTSDLRVAAFVPARDEAEVVEAALAGLRAQPELEAIWVVDDRSTDATPAILARVSSLDVRVHVLAGEEPAPGTLGKPGALLRALAEAEAAPGGLPTWLLFVDADVRLEPGAVSALLAAAPPAGLVTVLPDVECVGLAERLVMPTILAWIAARFPATRVEDAADPLAFANGQVILVDRATYAAAGGHAAVRAEVLEDCALAARVKQHGGALRVVDARALVRTRMYGSWRELREGWSKNLALLLGPGIARPLAVAAGSLVLGTSAWALAATGVLVGAPGLGLTGAAGVLLAQGWIRRRAGFSAGGALLAPLGVAGAVLVLLESLHRHHVRRRVEWKGRGVSV